MAPFVMAQDSLNNATWQPADSAFVNMTYNNTIPRSYILADDSIGWENVDQFYQSPPDINISLNTLSNPNPDSTYAYVWFTGYRAVWDLNQDYTDHSKFSSGHVKEVPVTIIAFSIHQGKIYAGFQTLPALTANAVYDLTLVEMTDAEFKSAIEALQ